MDYFIKTANEGNAFQNSFIFDCHGHFGVESGFFIPKTNADEIIAVLDRVGINAVAVSSFSNGIPFGNDIVAQAVSAYPERFIGYVRVNANYTKDIGKELTRCFDRFGFKGIKIHPYRDQVSLDDIRYNPVWEFAAERKAPILIHTWNSMRSNDSLIHFCIPSKIEKIARDYPDAKIILGHSGGEYDGILEAIRMAKALANVYLDTASSRLYPGVIEMMVNEVGAGKVLYGSDVPFISPVPQIGKIVYADIDESDKRKILGHNAAKIFGINIEN